MKKTVFIISIIFIFSSNFAQSQADSTSRMIIVSGLVRDENDQPIANAIVINQKTRLGAFGKPDGSFSIRCNREDTLSLSSLGFHPRNISCRDSVMKDSYYFGKIFLETRVYRIGTVEIFGQRDLERIQQDIKKLGYDENDFMISGLNAMQSPITFLYQQFSRKEQSKRKVAELENADNRRDLLKELFKYYVDYQIIVLSNEQFDDFVVYLNVSDEFMKSSTQYDFLIYVRDRFKDYKIAARQQKTLKETDFNYDKD